eukprot:SAG22_NODE_2360_length_2666_cov_1.181924_1_plen_216_part_00
MAGQLQQVLLRADGGYLSLEGGKLLVAERCGDAGIWVQGADGGLTSALTGAPLDQAVHGTFVAETAPGELPSVYLGRLRSDGSVLMPNLLTADEAATVRAAVLGDLAAAEQHDEELAAGEAQNEGQGRRRYLKTEPLVMRLHTHPVMLWVLQVSKALSICCASTVFLSKTVPFLAVRLQPVGAAGVPRHSAAPGCARPGPSRGGARQRLRGVSRD